MAQDEGHVIAYDFEPLTFYSFDSLTASIEEMRGNNSIWLAGVLKSKDVRTPF